VFPRPNSRFGIEIDKGIVLIPGSVKFPSDFLERIVFFCRIYPEDSSFVNDGMLSKQPNGLYGVLKDLDLRTFFHIEILNLRIVQ